MLLRGGGPAQTNFHLISRTLREEAQLALMGVCLISFNVDSEMAICITVSEGGGSQPAKFRIRCTNLGTVTLNISEDLNLSFSTVIDDGKEDCVEYQVS